MASRNAGRKATPHHWQVARRRNGDNTLAYLMKLPHPAGCGKLGGATAPSALLLRLLVVLIVAKRKVAGQVQRNQAKLGPVTLRIDRDNMLMLLRSRL